jgi:hypothetical protein
MWIRKALRDMNKGVDSPMPTQAVSNEEFVPRPQTQSQKHIEHLITEMSTVRAKKLGIERRDFMRTSMGLATCFLASNAAYGKITGMSTKPRPGNQRHTMRSGPKVSTSLWMCNPTLRTARH